MKVFIIRDLTADYQFGKRNKSMMKLKRLINAEFQIIGIRPQDNDPELGLYTCMTKDGIEFNVTPLKMKITKTNDYGTSCLLNKDLSCVLFYEYTDKRYSFSYYS
jgi:hypothetical protein